MKRLEALVAVWRASAAGTRESGGVGKVCTNRLLD